MKESIGFLLFILGMALFFKGDPSLVDAIRDWAVRILAA